ncbi:mitochondrial chaperone ATPase [Blastomyces gilchristii SLH14081]|uniref:Mitochondrial chaperone ATPase n=1 Tax=Blastomyces gilchristii (strain SLH14081) TaxID=559298 RepID=A0A179V035_BLAGS|nr:mitochondrial chaperone ATPase [Blastomyces gilchristii SLH14081]OAT13704.1 mitochondrial chaperone ATPase [Blastomyces gilchristii SLH14081]
MTVKTAVAMRRTSKQMSAQRTSPKQSGMTCLGSHAIPPPAQSTSGSKDGNVTAGHGFQNALRTEKEPGILSLSAVLNAIDGIVAPEGRILVMTTNHPKDLIERSFAQAGQTGAFPSAMQIKALFKSFSTLSTEFPMITPARPFPASL